MKKEVIPVIVSTVEALENALAEQCPVICVEKTLYNERQQKLLQRLKAHGYAAGSKIARTVVLFQKVSDKEKFVLRDTWKVL